MKGKRKVISFVKPPRKVPLRSQESILAERKKRREELFRKLDRD